MPMAQERTKVRLGYTAVADFYPVFVAAEQGYFSKSGLDVEFVLLPLTANVPPGLESDSIQIGGVSPSVFISAIDGGLDHVALAGATIGGRNSTELGLVARAGSGIHTAQDCVGKKIGVAGIGSALHVSFRAWLIYNKVDWRKVVFVEAAFPQQPDLLRGGTVDAVVSAEPFMSRIVDSGVGYIASYYTTALEDDQQKMVYEATRAWTQKNPGAVKAFRQSLAEASAFAQVPANDPAVRAAIGKYIKLPPPVLAKIKLAPPQPVLTAKALESWVVMMQVQDMLKSKIDAKRLLVP
ncbi:NitT/TauT family transport system substrate-binding protein [Variovorax sp. OV329]|nr:NitT/TauT family transport system substrate-binding protein [Variovorax sp. OV329]